MWAGTASFGRLILLSGLISVASLGNGNQKSGNASWGPNAMDRERPARN